MEAVADIIEQFEDIEVNTEENKFDGTVEPNSVVIMAVDSMKSRKEIWNLSPFHRNSGPYRVCKGGPKPI